MVVAFVLGKQNSGNVALIYLAHEALKWNLSCIDIKKKKSIERNFSSPAALLPDGSRIVSA